MDNDVTVTTFDEVRRIASDIFGISASLVTRESSPDSIDRWDSVQHLNLVLAIEEAFGLQLTPDEMEQMHSIGGIAELIEAKRNSTATI